MHTYPPAKTCQTTSVQAKTSFRTVNVKGNLQLASIDLDAASDTDPHGGHS